MLEDKSEIEMIGLALYGESWMNQLSKNLVSMNGSPIARQTIQNWHKSNFLPPWAKEQLKLLAQQRLNALIEINNYFNSSTTSAS